MFTKNLNLFQNCKLNKIFVKAESSLWGPKFAISKAFTAGGWLPFRGRRGGWGPSVKWMQHKIWGMGVLWTDCALLNFTR